MSAFKKRLEAAGLAAISKLPVGSSQITTTTKNCRRKIMRIITISREFGSGGRELGKRLADALGFHATTSRLLT